MDLRDSPEQARFRADLRAWLAATDPDVEAREWGTRLHEAGYAGLTWPVAHGGRGLTPAHQGIFAEECALAGVPDHPNVIGLNMVGPTLIRFGSAEQQRQLSRILSGERLFCQGFSEPAAGSDLAAIETRAVASAGGYRVTGEKLWSSYAPQAHYCLLLARTDPTAERHSGLTCFLLDVQTPGVTVRPLKMITGETGFGQILLDNVWLSDADVVGEPGAGWKVALTTLAHERGTFGITLTARLAVQFGRLVETVRDVGRADDPRVRQTLGRLAIDLEGLRQTGYRALSTLEKRGVPGPESTVLKLRWSQVHQRLCAYAAELARRHPSWSAYWQRQRLRSRGNSIEGGTSEILRGIIAEHVAGLPRSR
ncbi:acyl-CoA dehydrogenase family protein [Plantactinospora sp. WMMC1484]|uniref:acyl-CoA dehydrogenase family protein n=1 Tax=Plantactinospora sp. WMMC1484 TaxID=3404122 RepID=UPI003BF4D86D